MMYLRGENNKNDTKEIIFIVLVKLGTLFRALKGAVRSAIGPIATPDYIIYSDLPKVDKIEDDSVAF